MTTMKIDNLPVQVPDGATILDAARKLGIEIPTLCHLEGCLPQTACLVCVVKVDGSEHLIPACATKVREGMNVDNAGQEVREARRTALELMLADHAGDCLAPCQHVCPGHMDIPSMIRLINAGQLRDAIAIIRQSLALPAILGRICPELCEKGCRRGQRDLPVSIRAMEQFVADADLASPRPYQPDCKPATGNRVAIVGAGPTGLSAAYYLQQQGHACTLLDNHPQPGGSLRYAIPEVQLPRSVLDAEIALIQSLGTKFTPNVRVGIDVTLSRIIDEYDAVLLAIGQVDSAKAETFGLSAAARGLKVDSHSMMTSIPGIFAAGSAIRPLQHAVRAIADGRTVAELIDQYLRGKSAEKLPPHPGARMGKFSPGELDIFMAAAVDLTRSEECTGLTVNQATGESARCMHCDCVVLNTCNLRRYAQEYQADPTHYRGTRRTFSRISVHPEVIYESGKCIACGLCVQITSQSAEPLGLTFIGRGFNVRIGVPFNAELSRALHEVAMKCVQACPTGALVLKKEFEKSVPAAPSRIALNVLNDSSR